MTPSIDSPDQTADHQERAASLRALVTDAATPGTGAPASRAVPADADLVAVFRHLSDRDRKLIWWADVEGAGPDEIARRLHVSPNAAAALVYRAHRALREACRTDLGADG